MRNLLLFIQKFNFVILFIVLEVFSLFLAISSNVSRKSTAFNSANVITGFIYEQINFYRNYFYLRKENEILLRDNTQLRNEINSSYKFDTAFYQLLHDTIFIQQYSYQSARILKNSIHKPNNYITIDKGSKQGVEEDMAVINADGVIGIVVKVSTNFSTAISLLNSKIGISAKIKANGYYGSVVWDGQNYMHAILKEIPNHVELNVGDTIVTSGYSSIFPEGILIGEITEFEKNSQDNFYTIKVKLSVDFKNIQNVYLIKNLLRKEQLQLEEEVIQQLE